MILFYGDTHGDLSHVLPTVKSEKPAAIILLGDIESPRPLEQELADVMKLTEVYFIHGNHDTDSQLSHDNLFNSALADRNLHGRIVEIDGLKVAGLGGVFREKIWDPDPIENDPCFINYGELESNLHKELAYHKVSHTKVQGELKTHKSSIFYEDWFNLHGQKADILVTHEAPSCHHYGFTAIDILAKSLGVKKAFHGHQHDNLDYSQHHAALGFKPHGVGLRGVTDIHGNVIKTGEKDEQRMNRGKK